MKKYVMKNIKMYIISTILILVLNVFMYFTHNIAFVLFVDTCLLLYIITILFYNKQESYKIKTKDIPSISGDKFHKILIKCVDDKELLLDENWTWYIEELDSHKYQVDGYHPVCKRMTYIKEHIVV